MHHSSTAGSALQEKMIQDSEADLQIGNVSYRFICRMTFVHQSVTGSEADLVWASLSSCVPTSAIHIRIG